MNSKNLYIVFFSSFDFVSTSIRKVEKVFFPNRKVFSHVGLLFHESILNKNVSSKICSKLKNEFLVIESTLSGSLNDGVKNTCGKTFFGVQVRSFNELVKHYKDDRGKIAICKITNFDLFPNRDLFNNLVLKVLYTKYENIIVNLLCIHLPFPVLKSKRMFCSELVYFILNNLNIIEKQLNPKKVSPNMFFKLVHLDKLQYIV